MLSIADIFNTGNPIILGIFLFAGLGILWKGGDYLIKGAEALSVSYQIDPFIIGLTVVAFGTSLPEFFVSFIANLSNSGDIALGNVLGSNVANIALVLGVASILTPIMMKKITLYLDIPIMFFISVIFYILMLDGTISRIDGIILTFLFVSYIAYVYIRAKKLNENLLKDDIPETTSRFKDFALITLGIVGLYFGSDLTIAGASGLARTMGVSELAIGLTIVAIGTSLPELVATLQAIKSGNHHIGVGNIIGSNVFNLLFVIGINSCIKPFVVASANIYYWGPLMLFITLILFPMGFKKNFITKTSGYFLLGFYILYLVASFVLK